MAHYCNPYICSDLSCTTYITLTAKILRQMIDYGNKIMNYFYSVYLAQLNIVLLLCRVNKNNTDTLCSKFSDFLEIVLNELRLKNAGCHK